MIRFILSLVLIFFSANAFSQDLCMSGSWYDTERDGEGIHLQIADTFLYGYIFEHRPGGMEWFTFLADRTEDTIADDYMIATLYRTVKLSESPYSSYSYPVGTVDMDFIDSGHITFVKDIKYDLMKLHDPNVSIPWCLAGCTKTYEYVRLTTVHNNECVE